jgi:hypothetical protein
MRIAAIYWPTSSVGGINSVLVALRKAALDEGDTFEVIESGIQATVSAGKYAEPTLLRGGDTYITVHGRASHHPSQIAYTRRWLEANYDALYFAYIVPHPTKDYVEPFFLELYVATRLPKVAFITDAYWDTYAEWAVEALPWVQKCFVTNPAYAEPIIAAGVSVEAANTPFYPLPVDPGIGRSEEPYAVWTSQWKQIKCVNQLVPVIPAISEVAKFDLFSNGIRYYQFRCRNPEKRDSLYDDWYRAVGTDYFGGPDFNGSGRADFYGYQPLEMIPNILSVAWWMLDWQGLHKPRHKAYINGSYNCTAIEALYYGACPLLAEQARKSSLPKDTFLTIAKAEEAAPLIRDSAEFALDPDRRAHAREYVNDVHHARVLYRKIKEAYGVYACSGQ